MNISLISQERLLNAKIAYTPRNLNLKTVVTLLEGEDVIPCAGDMLLAKVTKIGHHAGLELAHGRRSALFVGDEIIVCYGNRYAPDQFEAQVPPDLGLCDLVASGGVAARMNHRHANAKAPTSIQPIGLLADINGQRINLKDTALPKLASLFPRPYTVGVVGTSMNAGKTTTAATLIRGMVNAGYKVGAAKVTGTGSGRDTWLMTDAGSKLTLDFTHAGFPSTYLVTPEGIDNIIETLVAHLSAAKVDAIVIEVADGLLQCETAALLDSKVFAKTIDSLIFAAGDAMGAAAGVECLKRKKLPVTAISGRLTASPLAVIETEKATGLPVLDKATLSSGTIMDVLHIPLQKQLLRNILAS
jgi:molybdopterin-guanine dinucleotide biosynthesis protein